MVDAQVASEWCWSPEGPSRWLKGNDLWPDQQLERREGAEFKHKVKDLIKHAEVIKSQ